MDLKTRFKNIPNWLTYLRLGLIPLFVFLLIDPSPVSINVAVAVFILAAITDYADGFIARKFGAVSDFGKLLDPLADKILVLSALIMLASLRSDDFGEPWVPGWMVVLVVAREVWVTGLRGLAANQGIVVGANAAGKWKSLLQMISIVFLLLHDYEVTVYGNELACQLIGLNLLLLSLVFSYFGAVEYTLAILFYGETPKVGGEDSGADESTDIPMTH